jgi:hypothetical protein
MGRSIPSISHRLDSKIRAWQRYAKLLKREEKEAFLELISCVKNQREAIGAADEADLGVAILLAMAVNNRRWLNDRNKKCNCRTR